MRIANRFESLGNFIGKPILEEPGEFARAHFNPGKIARGSGIWGRLGSILQFGLGAQFMVPDSDVMEAEVAQMILRLFDHRELFRRDGFAMRDAGAQAGHLGFIGRWQTHARRQFPDFGLAQGRFFQRGANLELSRCLRPGAVIAHITGIFSVSDHRKTFAVGNGSQAREQFMFAEVTAIGGIGRVIRIGKLASSDDTHREVKLFSDGDCLFQFTTRQTGGIGNDRQRPVAKDFCSHIRQKYRVHAAGIRYQAGLIRAQERSKLLQFIKWHEGKMPCSTALVEPGIRGERREEAI